MTIAFWIALGIIAYLNIGYRWGRLSWKAWGKKSRSFAGLFSFPVSYKKNEIGTYIDDGKSPYPFIVDYYKKNKSYDYAKMTAVLWPFKALFNICTLLCFGFKYFFVTLSNVIIRICSKVIDTAISPSRVVPKKTEEIPKAKALHKKSS
jgi:hypothetical protein